MKQPLVIFSIGLLSSVVLGSNLPKQVSLACQPDSGCPQPFIWGQAFRPTSCLDYLRNGQCNCGVYRIYDNTGQSFPVYCDMKAERGSAWTLVMSWSQSNRALDAFQKIPFMSNAPVNENTPNWKLYRQTLARIQSLKSHSTHWRATCSFPTHGVDYTDYVRGNFKDFDIVKYSGAGQCKKVELINIRGHLGIQMTAKFWQGSNAWTLHTDASYTGCQFVATSGSVSGEDNFGHYGNTWQNPKFRCTAGPQATTQWWFGGYM